MRLWARRIILYLPVDIVDALTGKRHKYEPPKGIIYIGSGDGDSPVAVAQRTHPVKTQRCCTRCWVWNWQNCFCIDKIYKYRRKYEGFDVVELGVKWCNRKISKDFPNFNFLYVPLNNDLYNNSSAEAQNFKFPYTDHSFDKVFLFSVFTHVSVNEIGNYLVEIKRVLKPGGLCLSTFFIYTDDEEEMISSGCGFYFPVKKENYRLMSNDVQSANIALNESLLNQLLSNARLEKLNTIHGYWKGKSLKHDNIDFHDVVIMKA